MKDGEARVQQKSNAECRKLKKGGITKKRKWYCTEGIGKWTKGRWLGERQEKTSTDHFLWFATLADVPVFCR